jgi:hypothetical protein
MDFLDVAGIFTTYRTFLNAIPAADVAAEAVQQQHLVRPVVRGYPAPGLFGLRQIVQPLGENLLAPPSSTNQVPTLGGYDEWGRRRERFTIRPALLDAGAVWLLPVGWITVLPSAADVRVEMQFEWWIRGSTGAVSSPTYPHSTGGVPAKAGRFALFTQRRFGIGGSPLATEPTEQTETEVPVWPLHGDALDPQNVFADSGSILWTGNLLAGVWQFWLGYVGPDPKLAGLVQIDVGSVSGTLEALL